MAITTGLVRARDQNDEAKEKGGATASCKASEDAW